MPKLSTLDEAKEAFIDNPTNATAGAFMTALMEAESEGELGDDEWLNGLASVRDYLT
jgi:hypothetical protein